jgi:hypothetical protein
MGNRTFLQLKYSKESFVKNSPVWNGKAEERSRATDSIESGGTICRLIK